MADWTAITGITGIVVSGVVGPSVAAHWASRRQTAEATAQITLADRAAARTLLDDAARTIRDAIGNGGALQSAVITWGAKLGGEGQGRDEWQAFRAAAKQVDLLGPSVTVMFGKESDVTKAFAACLEAFHRMGRGAAMIPHMEQAEGNEGLRYYHDVEQGLEQATAAHERFLEAAHGAVGVD
jgi:hypothetical protein